MFAFVHIGKAAGSTMSVLLRRSFGPAHCDVEPWGGYRAMPFGARDYRWVRLLHPPLRSIAGHTVTPWSDLATVRPDVRYYTLLREPIARMASHYQYHEQQMGKRRSFEEFIRIPRQRNYQCALVAGTPSADAAIETIERNDMFVGLLEEFAESLRLLDAWMGGVLALDVGARNVAPSQAISKGLLADPRAVARIREANEEDLKLHRWATETWMKRQRERLGGAVRPAPAGGRRADLRAGLARLHRNVVYKPALRVAQRIAERRAVPGEGAA